MAETTIEWATYSYNCWIGCSKVSPACKFCYAERDFDHRHKKVKWGDHGTRVITSDDYWKQPLKWDRKAEATGVRPRVFCASLADVFEDWTGEIRDHQGNPLWICDGFDEWQSQCFEGRSDSIMRENGRLVTMDDVRRRLFELIDATPHLDWLLLTKRPENIRRMWPAVGFPDAGQPGTLGRHLRLSNVWLGTSVENQEWAAKRIPELLKCRDLSSVLFLSCEPLLGPVDLGFLEPCDHKRYGCDEIGCWKALDWIIAGGESGPHARPSHPDWFRSLRDQCEAAGVPFLFKQWGEWVDEFHPAADKNLKSKTSDVFVDYVLDEGGKPIDYRGCYMQRVGKKAAGRLLDGVTHDGFPAHERVGNG